MYVSEILAQLPCSSSHFIFLLTDRCHAGIFLKLGRQCFLRLFTILTRLGLGQIPWPHMGGIVLALILRCAAAFSCAPGGGQWSCLPGTSGDPARGRDLMQVKSVAKQAKQALEWRVLQRFPPMTLRQPVGSCKNIGRQFPELVSRDLAHSQFFNVGAQEIAPY